MKPHYSMGTFGSEAASYIGKLGATWRRLTRGGDVQEKKKETGGDEEKRGEVSEGEEVLPGGFESSRLISKKRG